MKLKNLFILVTAVLATALTSCSDEQYEGGAPAGDKNVSFAEYSNMTIASDATSFDVTLTRSADNAAEELVVPIEVLNGGIFTLTSEKAVFAAGATTAIVSVNVPEDMAYNKAYPFSIRIPESYTNPYEAKETYPIYSLTVTKEDYELYATCTFEDGFWYEESWDAEIYYSPSQDLYRMPDVYTEGYPMYYKLNAETGAVTICNSEGKAISKWYPGLVDGTYGEVGADCAAYASSFGLYADEETGEEYIYLPFKWVVAAGSFGVYECYISNIQTVK